MDRNQPAPNLPEETTETLDPNETWSPQPSTVYDLQDNAAEGAAKPAVNPVVEADRLMAQRQDTTGGCAAEGNSPFVIPDHEIDHTAGGVKECDFAGMPPSGQGQSVGRRP